MIGTWLLCAKCKIKVNAFNTYNWWLVHDCYTQNARLKLMDLVHRINDWYMIVIREMHVSVVVWSLYHLQDFCCGTERIHNFVFQSSRILLDFRIFVKFAIDNSSIVGIATWPAFPNFKCDPQHRSWLFIWISDLQLAPTHWSVEIITFLELPKSPTQCAL